MSRAYEDAQERRLHQHIANELGISPEVLDDHPYEIDENSSDDGVVYNWRVQWDDKPPAGVISHGEGRYQWSDINEMHEPDGPEDLD